MSILEQQAAAFRRKHAIPEGLEQGKRPLLPSVLFSPHEAKWYDADAWAALGRKGLSDLAPLDPDLATFESLFEGPQRDREMLTKDENAVLDTQIQQLLKLLSPHLQLRAAQEIFEALIQRHHVHTYNIDEVLACAFPYHDSPFFTRLLQGLNLEIKQQWTWLQPLKKKPATLVRSALAKYCAKDLSVLTFIGEVLQDTVKLQKPHRPLATFFTSVWLDTLAAVQSVSPQLVETALPPILAAIRKPHLKDTFHAALSVVSALFVKVEMDKGLTAQLLERAAKQTAGEQGRSAAGLLALVLQLQAVDVVPEKVLRALAAAGPEAVVRALPPNLDCANLLIVLVELGLFQAATKPQDADEVQKLQAFVNGLFEHGDLIDSYGQSLALAVLQAFCKALLQRPADKKKSMDAFKVPMETLSKRQPVALGAAFRNAVGATQKNSAATAALVELLDSTPGGTVPSSAPSSAKGTNMVPLMDALSDTSPAVRRRAVEKAVVDLERCKDNLDEPQRQRLLLGMVMQSLDDEDLEVVEHTLSLKSLWVALPQLEPAVAVRSLEALLSKLSQRLQPTGDGIGAMFAGSLLTDSQTTRLMMPALRSITWVYSRTDCSPRLRARIDSVLLPLLLLCIVGPDKLPAAADAAAERQHSIASELQQAALDFCKVSELGLLAGLKQQGAKATAVAKLLAEAADTGAILVLCDLAEARPFVPPIVQLAADAAEGQLPPASFLGGAAAQVASASVLAQALSQALDNLRSSPDAESMAARCAEACQRFAYHQGLTRPGKGECVETLRQLVSSTLTFICCLKGGSSSSSSSSGSSGSSARSGKRRRSGTGAPVAGTGSSGGAAEQLLRDRTRGLLQLALGRPQSLQAEIRLALATSLPQMRSALLNVALAAETCAGQPPAAGASAARANALLLLRGLLASPGAADWRPDPSLLPPLLVAAGAACAPEARGAALAALEALRGCCVASDAAAGGSSCWEAPFATALDEAGVLYAPTEALSPAGWAAATGVAGPAILAAETLDSVLDAVAAHRAEVLRDGGGVALALSKALSSTAGKSGSSAKVSNSRGRQASAFLAVGMSLLVQDTEMLPLLRVIPLKHFLVGLAQPLFESARETLSSIREGKAPGVPRTLRLAAQRVLLSLKQKPGVAGETPVVAVASAGEEPKSAEAAAAVSFVREAVLPFCSGLAAFLEGDGELKATSVVDFTAPLCECLAVVASSKAAAADEQLRMEATVGLFRLSVAASALLATAATTAGVAADAGEAKGPEHMAVGLQGAAEKALLELPINAAIMCSVLNKVTATTSKSGALVAAELLCKQVTGLSGAAALNGGPELLVALTSECCRAANSHEPAGAVAEGVEVRDSFGTAEQLLLAAAALSENLAEAHAGEVRPESASELGIAIPKVCGSIRQLCAALGQGLSANILAATLRACGALAPFTAEVAEAPPLDCCIVALTTYEQPLRADVLSILRAQLQILWLPLTATSGAAAGADQAKLDTLAHIRLRRLLQTLIVDRPMLLEQACDVPSSRALALSAGARESADIVALLFMARRGPPTSTAAPRKKTSKKRRADRQERLMEEMLGDIMPQHDADAAADDAVDLLTSVGAENRYHCFGTLVQTLSALASALHKQQLPDEKVLGPLWEKELLPETFLTNVGAERASWVLEQGLTVACRLVQEQGLPEGLDKAEPELSILRAAAAGGRRLQATQGHVNPDIALAVCYAAWSACLVEVLTCTMRQFKAAQEQARNLRKLLLRSLAVNHPQTFFRAVCLMLNVPKLSPASEGKVVADPKLLLEVESFMLAACDALQERADLRQGGEEGEEDEAEDTEDSEVQTTCAPLVVAIMTHVSQRWLAKGEVSKEAQSKNHRIITWRFLDALCKFSGRSTAKPVAELYLPPAADCLAELVETKTAERSTVQLRETAACCLCLETAVASLGKGVLNKLSLIVKPLLDLLNSDDEGRGPVEIVATASGVSDGDEEHTIFLEQRVLLTLKALVVSVGSFMSPFLESILHATTAPSPFWKTALFEELAQDLVKGVPPRLLLPAVHATVAATGQKLAATDDAASAATEIDISLVRLQRLASVFHLRFTDSVPVLSTDETDAMSATFLRMLAAGGMAAVSFLNAGGKPEDLPARLLRRRLRTQGAVTGPGWVEQCSEGAISMLYKLATDAFAQFALGLDVEVLKPCLSGVVNWARHTQAEALERQAARKSSSAVNLAGDTDEACRVLALCTIMKGLAAEVPELAEEMLLPLVVKDLASSLTASRRCAMQLATQRKPEARKRRRAAISSGVATNPRTANEVLEGCTWWWFDVSIACLGFIGQALKPAAKTSEVNKTVEDALELLLEPCTNMLDVCEFLPPVEDSPLSLAVLNNTQAAVVALAAASDSGMMKKLLSTVLAKSRSDDVEVRLASVRCCHRVWMDLGVQAASGLSEAVMHASELLEDEDPRVEAAVRLLIRSMEDSTGESLQDALKH